MPLAYRWINFYPPFVGAGIRVTQSSADPYTMRVRLGLHWYNGNAFGTHFGGSLYAMCDPFFALILLQTIGRGYLVWDKTAAIQFLRPGRGVVKVTFHIAPEQVAEIRGRADAGAVVEPAFQVDVLDEAGQVVARVDKLLYVRKKTARG